MLGGVIFDLDDTLIESESVVEEVEFAVFKKYGAIIPDNEKPGSNIFRTCSFPELLKHFLPGKENLLRELSEERTKMLSGKVKDMKAYPDAIKVLKYLKKRGLKLGIGTGNSRSFFDLIDKNLKLSKLVDAVACRDEVNNGKPAPDIFLKVLEKMRLAPENVMVIGDSEGDIQAGISIGSKTVLVERTNTVKIKPDYKIKSLAELLEEPFVSIY